jgi:hypothetical protein
MLIFILPYPPFCYTSLSHLRKRQTPSNNSEVARSGYSDIRKWHFKFSLMSQYFKILIHREMGELNSADARDDVFDRPLLSQNIEKLEARRAYMNTI